ncbi:MAG TPA: hypothetical protein VM265_09575 [Sphingomicrobium sp.]|jgi:hypothetical protein|nr:hypothetical protein [Sphingomicrobium sp.]
MRLSRLMIAAAAAAALGACQTSDSGDASVGAEGAAATDGTGSSGTGTGGTTGGTGTSIPSLVTVDLRNVLNNLSVSLNVEQANIPVNAQVPIDVAANVCGVSISALSASIANGQATCTATSISPALSQAVQQQISAGGDVQGGSQTMNFM